MAVLSASGCWLPRGLTFGPTNGPEDFQELVFTVFDRRLYKDWYLFVDDLSVATGRKPCHPPGPSGAHDVVTSLRAETEKEKNAQCLGPESAGDPSPYAHWEVGGESSSARVRVRTSYTPFSKWRRRIALSNLRFCLWMMTSLAMCGIGVNAEENPGLRSTEFSDLGPPLCWRQDEPRASTLGRHSPQGRLLRRFQR